MQNFPILTGVFLCRLLCRLTYALCLNFLAVIHLDGHVTRAAEQVETSFTKVRIIYFPLTASHPGGGGGINNSP